MPVYVIGHLNPDTDAVCSAIAYADLLRQTLHPTAEAAACGPPNARTEFVLQTAGLEPPTLLMDVRTTAKGISRQEILFTNEEEPFFQVYRRMREHRLKSVPVLSAAGKVVGMLPLLNILRLLVPSEDDPAGDRFVDTSFSRIDDALGGTFVHIADEVETERLAIMIAAMGPDSFKERLHKWSPHEVILITGDRPDIHEIAIEYGVRCMVVTGGHLLDDDVLEKAKQNKVSILYSPHDTTRTTLLIKSARTIKSIIEPDFISFPETALVKDIAMQVQHEEQHLFPVLDVDGLLIGVFTKSDLISPVKTRLILVDHNEYGQAVKGASEAEILEVVDHHRLGGGLSTPEPIRFINEPVGSTCTMIARMFKEKAIMPRPPIALCLASGIVSDTLNLTSPTTTDVDRTILKWLRPCCALDFDQYVQDLFAMGSSLQKRDAAGVLQTDCKEYEISGWRVAVAQVEELGMQGFWDRKEELEQALKKFLAEKKLDFACLMITDITTHESLLLTSDDDVVNSKMGYPEVEANLYKMSGVVSRKKQLLPHLMQVLSRVSR